MSTPEVSCIIPTRDRADLVGDAIESALAQTGCALEVVVVDDGSTDDTAAVLARFAGRIRVAHTPRVGVAAARNHGLAMASGAFIAFLDSDDVWHEGKLAAQLDLMRGRPELGWSFTDYTVSERDPGGGWRVVQTRCHTGEVSLARLVERNFTGTLTVMARREIIAEAGGFAVALERGSDYDLWLRLARLAPFARVPGVLADYRWHAASLTGASRQRNARNYIDVITRLAGCDPGLFALAQVDPETLVANAHQRLAALASGGRAA